MKQCIAFFAHYKLRLLFLFAFLIRLIHLNQSLWLDEATTAMTVKTFGFFEIVTKFSPHDFHPPLYYLFMDLWTNIFGYSEIALRMPSVLFSMGTGLIIYLILNKNSGFFGRKLSQNDSVGYWSVAFFLFNPLIIYYSQEARMYSMTTFFIAISFYYLINFLTSNVKRLTSNFWLMNLFLILSFFTFYASIFYIATVWLYLVLKKQYHLAFLSFGIWILAFLAIVPLLLVQYAGSREVLVLVTNWSLVLGKVTLKNLLLFPIKFTSGRISFYPKMLYYALAGGWMGFIALIIITGFRIKSGMTKMALFFLIIPLILGVLFSFNSPLLQYFRFQYLLVFLSILLALAVCSFDTLFAHAVTLKGPTALIRKKVSSLTRARIIGIFVLMGFVGWSFLYLFFPQFHREDWKSLADVLKNEKAPIYMILSSSDPLKYYTPEIQARSLKNISIQGGDNTIVIIPYTADIHGIDYKQTLETNGYFHEDSFSVRGLSYEKWTLGES
ncbi:hypothetical protein CO051_07440 [Candidatus Roizmanbacteria bacterium CG_4_9_14_0_2_um_filter_39_13]|uniref:Glycosyltransferase RgtA/B/C/D-like domain-containing protein n=2 Tax=Candidatus Roizmaniibacteriota TaxID=1752723 RepID=A0A2M8EW63_9BACT|nr:MAG: hypothetical protein COY15_02585 [Candidatus Roizmanbacteria bacterium CG_4_10_14_0_2_um_filter_39_12]PJC30103.1 MAG: hypothetical protein CO051_07440 [Candidatus Roizmanbacteria bacterium CG_4_9_14_0_2_um_filter_39_13]PJE61854.1 MAG: hypothetical protein COU87_02350 [Candidatus Roizmanbacteria bacterium CG10_big_fil_rev_8_21_14_0_10_39_12]